ncbi:MAG: DUF5689 domain-containing protein [Chitinophagales bacterium]
MITKLNKLILMMLVFTTLSTVTSCRKDKIDEPPTDTVDPMLPTTSIADLKALFTSGTPITVTDDITISGIVVADDKSGNYYKTIIIDDGTAGLPVLIDRSGLYNDFPIGRKIYIKCKGLVLGEYNKFLQLGGFIDNSDGQPSVGNIPSALISNYIVKGPAGNTVTPIKINSLTELNKSFQARLIEIEPLSFDAADQDKPWADIITQQSLSRIASDCDGNELEVRTSNFAKFANQHTPTGALKFIGVFSVYGSTRQLTLREATEVTSTTSPCPVEVNLISENFNAASTSGNLSIAGWVNYSTAGSKYWYATGSSNKNARMSAFGSSDASNVGWLITPSFNLDGSTNENLTFRSDVFSPAGSTILEILYSTNYSGSGDPTAGGATWTLLGNVPNVDGSWTDNNISLNSLTGTIYIAFRYTGSGASGNTTQYNLDDVKVSYFQ